MHEKHHNGHNELSSNRSHRLTSSKGSSRWSSWSSSSSSSSSWNDTKEQRESTNTREETSQPEQQEKKRLNKNNNMRLLTIATLSLVSTLATAFTTSSRSTTSFVRPLPPSATTTTTTSTSLYAKTKTLGLLTFDLDDSLYPIDVVLDEANAAFARSMKNFGYDNIAPEAIAVACQRIRDELPPEEALVMTHTEIRTRAIRQEMERVILERKLKETADDWATPVSDLSPIVVNFAKKWASEAVSPSVVQAVLNAWEMERHHAAERHLYPEVMDVLQEIRNDHPDVLIGAVTDGKANPLFMTFTLSKYFDFCLSWEDDQAGRKKFFQDLGLVEGNAQLKWIYDAALEKYQELSAAKAALSKSEVSKNKIWIHVGDDLAYDVGGSAQSGAKTIWLELSEKYGQTARHRFENIDLSAQPRWSTSTRAELEKRRVMNEMALELVDKRVHFLSRLPEAINDIIDSENEMDLSTGGGSQDSGVAAME